MDHPDLTISNFLENSIGLKRINTIFCVALLVWWFEYINLRNSYHGNKMFDSLTIRKCCLVHYDTNFATHNYPEQAELFFTVTVF